MDFITDIRRRLLDSEVDRQLFDDDEITDELWRARLLNESAVKQYIGFSGFHPHFDDEHGRGPFVVDRHNGKLSIRLIDLLGTKREYLFSPCYALHDYGRTVTVQDGKAGVPVAADPAYYDYDELKTMVAFDDPRRETAPIVRVQGFLIDYPLAFYWLLLRLETKLTAMQDARGQEVTAWMKRVRDTIGNLRPSVVMRSGERV